MNSAERTGPSPRPAPSKADVEHTRWSPGLIGFYLSCAGVALGAAFAASGYCFFGSKGWLIAGSVISAVCVVTCFVSLHAARRPPEPPAGSR